MRSAVGSFSETVREALNRTAVRQLLAVRPAVILERLTRGAGATRWFFLASDRDLEFLYDRLAPGSRVSFYFDSRIAAYPFDDDAVIRVLDMVASSGDAVVGTLCADGLETSVEFVAGASELGRFVENLAPRSEVFIGAFPASDDDGRDAVTVTLPDSGGLTRAHPH